MKGVNMRYKAWPGGAIPLCNDILREQNEMESLFDVCRSEGVAGQRYSIIIALLPSIKAKAERIGDMCRQIRRLLPRQRRGRLPKWVTISEDVIALSMCIIRSTDCVERFAQEDEWTMEARWVNIQRALSMGLERCQKIKAALDSHPCRNDPVVVPDVYYQAFNGEDKL
jgi:hypothetical protein